MTRTDLGPGAIVEIVVGGMNRSQHTERIVGGRCVSHSSVGAEDRSSYDSRVHSCQGKVIPLFGNDVVAAQGAVDLDVAEKEVGDGSVVGEEGVGLGRCVQHADFEARGSREVGREGSNVQRTLNSSEGQHPHVDDQIVDRIQSTDHLCKKKKERGIR